MTSVHIGIMDPSLCFGQGVTATDRVAFDAIGWNLNVDMPANPGFALTMAQFATAAGVPQPATWALLIGGFGIAGEALRRQRRIAIHVSRRSE